MKFPAFEPIDLKNNVNAIEVLELCITEIVPDDNQPRKNFDEEALLDLSTSIKQYGILQPIIVKKIENGRYQIIAGERRWRASKLAGLKLILAIVQNHDQQENRAISLIENIQREELNPIELAEALNQLIDDYGLSHESIGSMIGKNRATVSNILRLLNLSDYVRKLLINREIEMGHARALLSSHVDNQIVLAQKIIEKKLSVRDTEKLVQFHKLPNYSKKKFYIEEIDGWTKKLSESLSSKIDITINENGEGKIAIHFSSPNMVDWLIERLCDRK